MGKLRETKWVTLISRPAWDSLICEITRLAFCVSSSEACARLNQGCRGAKPFASATRGAAAQERFGAGG